MCLSLDNRNTIHSYSRLALGSGPSFTSEGSFFFLDNLRGSDFPEPCVEAIKHLSCIITDPPCNVRTDLPLKICEESCVAYNMLMSGPTCDTFNEEVEQNFNLAVLVELRGIYLRFDCNDTTTYFFENDTVFDTENCTNLFSVENQGRCTVGGYLELSLL